MAHGFDIRASRATVLVAALAAVAAGGPSAGQLLDATLEDVVDREVTERVEQDVAEEIEDTVEQDVADAVEDTVESEVVDAVESQVESGVVEAVQEQVESGVVDAVEQQVEGRVVGAIADQLESSVAAEIGEPLLDDVGGELGEIAGQIEDAVRDASGNVDDAVRGVTGGEGASGEEQADARTERFAADVDALGRPVERDVWIILVPAAHAARIPGWGFTVHERQDLPTLDRILLRVAAPEDREIAQAALELALDAPGTQVDYNHVYRPVASDDEEPLTGPAAVDGAATAVRPESGLAIGLVDTAIARGHEALRDADIIERDFVPFVGERPTAHGTAVASVLVGDAPNLQGQLPGARVYAASVFFTDLEGEDAATAASLAASAEWLAAQGARVVNMSLAGPPNRVLEAATAALAERGIIVVAAVGNNGPNGEPLYPAAYSHVIGITAIDSAKRIYRYANRGPHVAFAAPGVDVRVARSKGGYRELTGTSIAAPHASALIARTLAARTAAAPAAVLAELKSAALDLGAKGFDPVFGFGLIEPLPALPVTASR